MGSPTDCQVAIIGAGPAGSAAAILLASRGREVILIDAGIFPRSKLCAGLLTAKTIDCLRNELGLNVKSMQAGGIIYHRLHAFRIYHRRRLLARDRLETPFHLADRRSYDAYLLRAAGRAGAGIITGQKVTRIDPGRGIIRTAGGKTIRSQVIIAADGIWSKARKIVLQAGRKNQLAWRRNLALALESRAPGFGATPVPFYAGLHLGYLEWGYGWSFPSPRQRLVGICGLASRHHGRLGVKFRQMLADLGIDHRLAGLPAAWPLPYGNYLSRPWHLRLLLAGDACGLADPLLGEGIYYAHKSGLLAARAVLAAGSFPLDCGPIYQRFYSSQLISNLRWIKLARNFLFGLGAMGPLALERFMARHGLLVQRAVHGQIPFRSLFGAWLAGCWKIRDK